MMILKGILSIWMIKIKNVLTSLSMTQVNYSAHIEAVSISAVLLSKVEAFRKYFEIKSPTIKVFSSFTLNLLSFLKF